MILNFKSAGTGSDQAIAAALNRSFAATEAAALFDDAHTSDLMASVDLALTDGFLGAMAMFLLALERGERHLVDAALARLRQATAICGQLSLMPQWWVHRIASHLIDDLWSATFHEKLPAVPPGGADAAAWIDLRRRFIAVLAGRARAEVDLWPSQIAAASRATNQSDDLVVSLPTSAGKTRIAELCILRCLAANRRVVFVTPLRALSAQTEVTLRRTFAPLGKTVSSLYGSIGAVGLDEDAIRQRNIVVATPEKLDFALRNDPTLLDDVGLLVFDEGHMIGLNDREVRYEVQIQRLLRRPDAAQRRIVCLSAILPDGDQLDDFANWLRRDQPGGIVRSEWRPTRLRYGDVVWNGQSAQLRLRVGEERPFVPRFLTASIPPIGSRVTPFPKDLGELCVATAWRLVSDGQTVLIFCPVRAHVEPFADRIINLHARGALPSLLIADAGSVHTALALGEEWLGANHPILRCLRLGVAIHHGALPSAYRKEIERLLSLGILKVTISSPTLAQGLNLSATVVIMHSLSRNRKRIETSEFKNVAGRAGRAYIDVEGLVLYPIFDKHAQRIQQWEQLIADTASREMESGLLLLLLALVKRMHAVVGGTAIELTEYVLNNTAAWTFPEVPRERAEDRAQAQAVWENHVANLDTAILSLIGEHEVHVEAIATTLDDILQSSLWQRRLQRRADELGPLLQAGLIARATYIWQRSTPAQRRGYFLAGIGLQTGLTLDRLAGELNRHLVSANGAVLLGDNESAIASLTAIAEIVFLIHPFAPDSLPGNWRFILRDWLLGRPLVGLAVGQEAEALQFVEGALVYRLPWAMEAIRVRGIANGDLLDGIGLDNFELSVAVPAVETGTLNRSAALLIQGGFNSRLAAIKAVTDTGGAFASAFELRQWLQSEAVMRRTAEADWPTAEMKLHWLAFIESFTPQASSTWSEQHFRAPVTWIAGATQVPGTPVRCHSAGNVVSVLSSDGSPLGVLRAPLNPARRGSMRVEVMADSDHVLLSYIGPQDLWLA